MLVSWSRFVTTISSPGENSGSSARESVRTFIVLDGPSTISSADAFTSRAIARGPPATSAVAVAE